MSSRERIRQACLTQIMRSLDEADVSDKPFPHFTVRNLLPSDIYAELMESLPETHHYITITKYDQAGDQPSNNSQSEANATPTRFRMGLESKNLDPLGKERAELWYGVRDALGDPQMKRKVFRLLQNGIAFRFGISKAEVEDAPGYPMAELYREIKGYSIKPHPDTRRKVVTMQLSLASDHSQSDLGTTFYRMSANPRHLLTEPRGFAHAKQMSFAPNSAYAFVVLNTVTKRSWHGREQLREGCGTRNSLLHLFYANPVDASPDLMARYYPEAQKAAA